MKLKEIALKENIIPIKPNTKHMPKGTTPVIAEQRLLPTQN